MTKFEFWICIEHLVGFLDLLLSTDQNIDKKTLINKTYFFSVLDDWKKKSQQNYSNFVITLSDEDIKRYLLTFSKKIAPKKDEYVLTSNVKNRS